MFEEILWLIDPTIIISASSIAFGFYISIHTILKNRTDRYVKFFEELERELNEVMRRGVDPNILVTVSNLSEENRKKALLDYYDRYSSDYLNILSRVAVLKNEKLIPKKLLRYFDRYFSYVEELIKWKETIHEDKYPLREWYKDLLIWVEIVKNKTDNKELLKSRPLPFEMKKLYREDKNQNHKQRKHEQIDFSGL